jgi:hypothetical protein
MDDKYPSFLKDSLGVDGVAAAQPLHLIEIVSSQGNLSSAGD